ncbi:MAG: ribosome recycling factor [Saprospiraceae bacterium]|nr:ribosome recycling factor [Saprospiraceae bacterium]
MTEESELCLEMAEEGMQNCIIYLEKELQKIRAGKASPAMLDSIKVDNYGVMAPINQVANINTPDARLIIVQPWDKSMLEKIERAIINGNLGFNPMNDGVVIRISVPPLTEERRIDLVKKAKAEGESGKVAVRNIRRTANDEAKSLEKDGVPEDEVKRLIEKIQELTNKFTDAIDKLLEKKEKDIMTV